jgi:hypothetical protein
MADKTRHKVKAQCQCSPSCKNPPLEKFAFCAVHLKGCSRKSPMSGYEPKFDPDLYNRHNGVKEAQNCFAYAFDYQHLPKKCTKESCSIPFPQPGLKSGYPKWSKVKGKRCPDLTARLLGDIPDLKLTTFEKRCPAKYSKIGLVVDEDQDYHFYRQDSNGVWSHKPGSTDVTRIDGTGRPIYDPQLASRKYPSGLHYDEFCGYLCVPRSRRLTFKRGGRRKGLKGRTLKRHILKRHILKRRTLKHRKTRRNKL